MGLRGNLVVVTTGLLARLVPAGTRRPRGARAGSRHTGKLRKGGVGLAVAAALLLAHVLPAWAAIEATLSSSEGRAGDLIVLTAENHGNANLYDNLAVEPHLIYLASKANFDRDRDVNPCAAAYRQLLGKLTWNSGVGSLSFKVPNVSDGDYYFVMTQTESSRYCWRIGAPAAPFGPLVLVVKGSGVVVSPVPAATGRWSPWAIAVIVVYAVVLAAAMVLVTVALRRRHDSG